MKKLHLLRHAKSAWDQPLLTDIERGLNQRGRRDAPRMGAALATRIAPMRVHVSRARRAELTLAGLCDGWPALAAFAHVGDDALYTFDAEDLVNWLVQRPDRDKAYFIIGHNPALLDLVNRLVGHRCLGKLPTCGYVELNLPIIRWRDVPRCEAVFRDSLFPKELPGS